MMKSVLNQEKIYVLSGKYTGTIFYVGKTRQTLKKRLELYRANNYQYPVHNPHKKVRMRQERATRIEFVGYGDIHHEMACIAILATMYPLVNVQRKTKRPLGWHKSFENVQTEAQEAITQFLEKRDKTLYNNLAQSA